jgi:hypothetical protein
MLPRYPEDLAAESYRAVARALAAGGGTLHG